MHDAPYVSGQSQVKLVPSGSDWHEPPFRHAFSGLEKKCEIKCEIKF